MLRPVDPIDRRLQSKLGAGLAHLAGQHLDDLPGRAVAEQLAQGLLVPGDAVALDQSEEILRGVRPDTEVVGIEGSEITTQELFRYEFEGEGADGLLRGRFVSLGLQPHFAPRAEYYGLGGLLSQAIG